MRNVNNAHKIGFEMKGKGRGITLQGMEHKYLVGLCLRRLKEPV